MRPICIHFTFQVTIQKIVVPNPEILLVILYLFFQCNDERQYQKTYERLEDSEKAFHLAGTKLIYSQVRTSIWKGLGIAFIG